MSTPASRRRAAPIPVAEQVSVRRPAAQVTAALTDGARWLQPFLALGWNEGEMARRRRGAAPREDGPIAHALALGAAEDRPDGTVTIPLRWVVTGAAPIFRRLEGEVLVRPRDGWSALGVVAVCHGAEGDGQSGGSSTPAELVVRSMLGRLRSALESGPWLRR